MNYKALIAFILMTSPAAAHQGDHSGFDFASLVLHVLEPDHVVFAAIAVLTGILAYRAGKRAGAAGQESKVGRDRGER
jgi:hypothetical protein